MKYMKKPVIIEAFKFYFDDIPDWFMDKVSNNEIILRNFNYDGYTNNEVCCVIKTLEGNMIGKVGEYIIKGVQGEIDLCKPDIFEATYERVEESE